MTYSDYSKNLLKFIYYLARTQKVLTKKEIQEYMKEYFGRVSSRTIMRWYKFLKEREHEDYSFDYYSYFRADSFGLLNVYVIFKNPINEKVLKLIPHIFYACIGRSSNFDKKYIATYLIPPAKVNDFKKIVKKIKEKNLVSDYEIIETISLFDIISPYHKVINEEGHLKCYENIDNSYFINQIRIKPGRMEMLSEIKKEPFIIPIVFEQLRESWSSYKTWEEIYAHIGEQVWDYVSNIKIKLHKNPEQAIKYIQRLIRKMNQNFSDYYEQVRVYYKPLFYSEKTAMSFVILNLKEPTLEKLQKISHKISTCALSTGVIPSRNFEKTGKVMFAINTSFKYLFDILKCVKDEDAKMNYIITDFQESHKKVFNRDFMKFKYWEVFDIEKKEWIFDTEKYLKNIEVLAKS